MTLANDSRYGLRPKRLEVMQLLFPLASIHPVIDRLPLMKQAIRRALSGKIIRQPPGRFGRPPQRNWQTLW